MNDNPQPNRPDPNEVLRDALLHTQPEARPEFRRALETRLAARIMDISPSPFPAAQPAEERTTPMSMTASPEISMTLNGHAAHLEAESAPEADMPSIETLTDVRHFRRFTLPLTLVAALVIGLLIFPTLMSMRDKNGSTGALPPAFNVNPEVTAEVSSTPGALSVVVAARSIGRGSRIQPEDLIVRSYPAEYAPINGFTHVDQVVGKYTRVDIFEEQPLLSTIVMDQLPMGIESEPTPQPMFPPDRVLAAVPVHLITTSYIRNTLNGMTVDLVITEFNTRQHKFTNKILASDAMVVYSVYLDAHTIYENVMADNPGTAGLPFPDLTGFWMYFAVTQAEANTIRALFQDGQFDDPIMLIVKDERLLLQPQPTMAELQIPVVIATPAPTPIPETVNMAPIAIPLNRLTNETENPGDGTNLVGLDPGSKVAIIHNRPGGGMSVIVPSASLISAELEVFAEGYASFLVNNREANALNAILSGSDDLFTLYPIPETQPESAPVVIVVTATPAPTARSEIRRSLLPIGTRMVALPMDRFSSVAYAVQEGDVIDIVHTPSDSGEPTIVVQAARVVYIGEFPSDDFIIGIDRVVATPDASQSPRPNIVAFAVSPDEAEALTALLEANASLTFLLRPVSQETTPAPTTTPETLGSLLPPGAHLVAMPLDRIMNMAYPIEEGDLIDIVHPQPDSDELITVVQAARVVYIGEFPSDDFIMGIDRVIGTPNTSEGSHPDIVAFAMSSAEAETLSALFDSATPPPLTLLPRPLAQNERQGMVDLSLDLIADHEALPRIGDVVDVYATLWFIDIDDEFQRVVPETESALKTIQLVAQDAFVVVVDKESNLIRLSVTEQEKITLANVAIWRSPITFVPSREPGFGTPQAEITPTPAVVTATPVAQSESTRTSLDTLIDGLDIPIGYRAVLLPMSRLSNPATVLEIGDRVNVFVTFLFVDKDEEFQTMLNPAVDGVEAEDARLMHQKVITDAHILGVFGDEYNLIALALKPEDMVTLTYLIESRTPLMILPEMLGQMASEMTSVEGGAFEMSEVVDCGYCLPAPDSDSSPAQEVTLDDFAIDVSEVSNAQYVNFLNWLGRAPENGCDVDGVLHPCITGTDDPAAPISYAGEGIYHPNDVTTRGNPVTQVTWYGADAYCRALGRRLPTEAEWEYVHRQNADPAVGTERIGFRCAVGAN